MSIQTVNPPSIAAPRNGGLSVPVLDKAPPRALRALRIDGHPVRTYLRAVLLSFTLVAGLSICLGLLVTHVVLHSRGTAADDESAVRFLVDHRSPPLTHASLLGSIVAGGVVLPIVAASVLLIGAVAKNWRLAWFTAFALALESGSYRATTLVVHRHRPEVARLETLPVNASYPSGHTASSIAVYWGIALLLSSRVASTSARILIWSIAALIPPFVAFSRMYRGMHHPLDVAGGVIVGIAALVSMVLVSRLAYTEMQSS
ncbi:MAG: phosphatase PAP2 family protein [Gaiellaceae bacterium]